MTPPNNYYSVLGIPKGATPEQIRSAFRSAILRHHPDKNNNSSSSQEHVIILKEAYDALSDPAKRAQHDALLAHYEAYQSRFQQQTQQQERTEQKQDTVPPCSAVRASNGQSGQRLHVQSKSDFDGERHKKRLWLKIWFAVSALCFTWFVILQPILTFYGAAYNMSTSYVMYFFDTAFGISLLFWVLWLVSRGGWSRPIIVIWLALEAVSFVAFRLMPRINAGSPIGFAFLDTGASDWTEDVNRGDTMFLNASVITTIGSLLLAFFLRLVTMIRHQRV